MKEIPLTQGRIALVDDQDYLQLVKYAWHAVVEKSGCAYARTNVKRDDGSTTTVQMHQMLLPAAVQVDHRDGDGVNNQRYNLRAVSRSQNQRARRRKSVGLTSTFRGVSWDASKSKWRASIGFDGKAQYLGRFTLEKEAAEAYNQAALRYFGVEFAQLNIVT